MAVIACKCKSYVQLVRILQMNTLGCEVKSGKYLYLTCLFPISEYAKKVKPRVTQRSSLKKISATKIHPMLIAHGERSLNRTALLLLNQLNR